MKETDQLKKLMEAIDVEEGTGDNIKRGLQGKVSKLEHAKRMGREAGKSGLRTLEVLSEFELDTLEPSLSKLVEETKTDIEKYLSILRNI